MPRRKTESLQGAPGWVVTYADFVTVLLCFFIALASMGEIKKDRFQQAAASLQRAFGGSGGGDETTPVETGAENTLIRRLMELESTSVMSGTNGPDPRGDVGKTFSVSTVSNGLRIVIGGAIAFDRFGAELNPEARELVAGTAQRLRGYNTRIFVRGHATSEPFPPGSPYADARDLSYARAKTVVQVLEKNGVGSGRILVIAAGDAEPFARQAYTEERRALNQRVEILVTEDLVDDVAGAIPADELKGSSDGN